MTAFFLYIFLLFVASFCITNGFNFDHAELEWIDLECQVDYYHVHWVENIFLQPIFLEGSQVPVLRQLWT